MNRDKPTIDLGDLLNQFAGSDETWPETDEEIRALLSQPAEPFSADERAKLLSRVLGADSAVQAPSTTDPAPTLFDHLDDVRIASTVDVPATVLLRRRGEDRKTIVDLYELVTQVYTAVRNQMSVDFVVLDPTLNAWFIAECRNLGATVSEYHLNKTLFNARKNGKLAHLSPSVSSPVPNARLDEYAFASEIALRLVQERWFFDYQQNVALDRILSDPRLREEFDRYAAEIAVGSYSTLELRWGALAQRKAGRRAKASVPLTLSMFDQLGKLRDLPPSRVPTRVGVYLCRCGKHDAYVGTTENLRERIDRHLAVGPDLIPKELRPRSVRDCSIGIIEMPGSRSRTMRNEMVSGFKRERWPMLNFVGLLPYAAA